MGRNHRLLSGAAFFASFKADFCIANECAVSRVKTPAVVEEVLRNHVAVAVE